MIFFLFLECFIKQGADLPQIRWWDRHGPSLHQLTALHSPPWGRISSEPTSVGHWVRINYTWSFIVRYITELTSVWMIWGPQQSSQQDVKSVWAVRSFPFYVASVKRKPKHSFLPEHFRFYFQICLKHCGWHECPFLEKGLFGATCQRFKEVFIIKNT